MNLSSSNTYDNLRSHDFVTRSSAFPPSSRRMYYPSTLSSIRTMPSPRKMNPSRDHKPAGISEHQDPSITLPLAPSSISATSLNDSRKTYNISCTNDVAKCQKLFEQAVYASKQRKAWGSSPPRERQRVPMSEKDFMALYEVLNNPGSDRRFPSISYNARTSTAIIKWMPSAVHEEYVVAFIENKVIAASLIPPAIAKRLKVAGSQDMRGFTGAYRNSAKQPDALFKYQQPNGDISYTCAIEIGFSEKYEDLLEDARVWIEGRRDIMTVILISVEEDPEYHCPTGVLEDDEIIAFNFPRFDELKTSMVVHEDPSDAFGPLSLHGFRWFNKTTAFLEIWKRDHTTGEARQQGARENFVGVNEPTTELDIKLKDLYPIDAVDGGDQRLPLTWELLKEGLESARKEQAVLRCQKMLMEVAKREDNIDDSDYIN